MTIEPATAKNTANDLVAENVLLVVVVVVDTKDSRARLKIGVSASHTHAAVGVVERKPKAYRSG